MKAALIALFFAAYASVPLPNARTPQKQPSSAAPTSSAESAKQNTAQATTPVAPPRPTPDERIADYTRWLMWFTGALMVFTAALAVVGIWQGILTRQSINLARDEFLASHRPQLVLRRVMFDEETTEFPAEKPQFMIEIANVGDSEATIARLAIRLLPLADRAGTQFKMRKELEIVDPTYNQFVGVKIANGDSHAIRVVQDERVYQAIAQEKMLTLGQGAMTSPFVHTLYCLGYVEYRDKRGANPRRTGFIRRAKFDARWFERLDGTDDKQFLDGFEYQD